MNRDLLHIWLFVFFCLLIGYGMKVYLFQPSVKKEAKPITDDDMDF